MKEGSIAAPVNSWSCSRHPLTGSPTPLTIATDLLKIFGGSGWSGGKAGTSTLLPVVMETSIPGDQWEGNEPHVVNVPPSPQQH